MCQPAQEACPGPFACLRQHVHPILLPFPSLLQLPDLGGGLGGAGGGREGGWGGGGLGGVGGGGEGGEGGGGLGGLGGGGEGGGLHMFEEQGNEEIMCGSGKGPDP